MLLTLATRTERIQALLTSSGGFLSVPELANLAFEEGIITAEDDEAAAYKNRLEIVRSALKRKDDSGLPFALPVDPEREIWKQREMFSRGDYEVAIATRVKGIREDHTIVVMLADECEDRFGFRPDIPTLI